MSTWRVKLTSGADTLRQFSEPTEGREGPDRHLESLGQKTSFGRILLGPHPGSKKIACVANISPVVSSHRSPLEIFCRPPRQSDPSEISIFWPKESSRFQRNFRRSPPAGGSFGDLKPYKAQWPRHFLSRDLQEKHKSLGSTRTEMFVFQKKRRSCSNAPAIHRLLAFEGWDVKLCGVENQSPAIQRKNSNPKDVSTLQMAV